MPLLADLFQAAILITALLGLGLASQRIWPEVPFCLHFCFAPLAFTACLFFLEHFLPLGQPKWLWIPGMVLSGWLIRTASPTWSKEPVLWYFFLGFSYCFLWRYTFPDIYPFSDRLNDHVHLMTYSAGGRLPAEDVWMKGNLSNCYYIFQYYAAGLIHRFLGSGPGLTFHLGYCAIIGLTTAAFGAAAQVAAKSIKAGWFACICLILGGNGATLVTPFMNGAPPSPLAAERFIGSYAMPADPEYKTAFGSWLVHLIGPSKVDAPMEYFSYAIYIGDYHPPLSCFFLMALAVLAIVVAEGAVPGSLTEKFCVVGAISTPCFMLISSTMTVPFQGFLILGWLIYRWLIGRRDSWQFLLLVGIALMSLIFPYFSQFAYQSGNYTAHFQLMTERPPFLNWVLVMLPGILLWICCLWAARTQALARLVVVVGFISLIVTYFFEIFNGYTGIYEIYDTTMKWWPWVFTFLIMMGLICIWPYRNLRVIVIPFFVLTILANSYIMGAYWWTTPKDHLGRLDGYAWFTDVPHQEAIYEQLQTLPKGVVLESAPDSGSAAITLAQFSGHYSLGGWTFFELFWRGNRQDIVQLEQNRDKFYNGKLDNAASWLRGIVPGGVDYIVWLNRDNDRGLDIWPKINDAIKDDYDWRSTFEYNLGHWGMWVKKSR